MTNEELCLMIQQGNDTAKTELINQNKAFVELSAWRYKGAAELDDLKQLSFIGMLRAAETYQPEKGSFLNWASYYIRDEILTGAKDSGKVPDYLRDQIRAYRRYITECETRTGTAPPDCQICLELDVTPADLERIRQAEPLLNPASLQSIDETGTELQERIADPESMEESAIETEYQRELSQAVNEALEDLPEKNRDAVRLREYDGLTFQAISEERGITPSAARQDYEAGLRKIRRGPHGERLRGFLDLYNEGLKGTGPQSFKRTWMSATERTALQDLGEL